MLTNGIAINPSSISPDKLAKMAWEIMEPEYNLKPDRLVANFEQARVKVLVLKRPLKGTKYSRFILIGLEQF